MCTRIMRMLLMVFLVLGTCTIIAGVISSTKDMYKKHRDYTNAYKYQQICQTNSRRKILINLQKIQKMPADVKRHSFIFMPSMVKAFWEWPKEQCNKIAYLVPAVTGIALLYGFPPETCHLKLQLYSYTKQDQAIRKDLAKYQNQHSVCKRALHFGASQVFYFDRLGNYKVWQCKKLTV